MNKITTAVVLTAVLAIAGGCATPYQKSGFMGGFSETRLDQDVWIVTFSGNGYTSRERAIDFNLLRCAELCMENQYSYFIITDGREYSSQETYTTPKRSHTTGSAYTVGNTTYGSSNTQTYGGQTYNISKPGTSNTIKCFKEKPQNIQAFSAEFVSNSIREKRKMRKPNRQ